MLKEERTLEVPAVWKKLIMLSFPEDLGGMTSEKFCKGNADPEPHYDDVRVCTVVFSDGVQFTLFLSSGQSNYWGSYQWENEDATFEESEPLESYEDTYERESRGLHRVVHIAWV